MLFHNDYTKVHTLQRCETSRFGRNVQPKVICPCGTDSVRLFGDYLTVQRQGGTGLTDKSVNWLRLSRSERRENRKGCTSIVLSLSLFGYSINHSFVSYYLFHHHARTNDFVELRKRTNTHLCTQILHFFIGFV